MRTYETPELLNVGAISGVVLGEKNTFEIDNITDPDTNHRSTLSIIDVD